MNQKNAKPETWDAFWSQKTDLSTVYPSSPTVLQTLIKKVPLKGKTVVEVGAGTGRDAIALEKLGAKVIILDFSPQSLKLVKSQTEQSSQHILSLQADAFKSPLANNSVDLVFHQGLLEHFTHPLELLKENYRILKPGGYCLCDVPQTFHVYTLVKKILIALDKWFAGWETQFTPGQLEHIMKSAGFSVEYRYGDWMRPSFFYRTLREIARKFGILLPKYPGEKSSWYQFKEQLLDKLSEIPMAHYTQLTIGVLGKK